MRICSFKKCGESWVATQAVRTGIDAVFPEIRHATDFAFQAHAGHPALYLIRGSNHQFFGGIPKSHDRAVAADRSAAIALGVKQPLDERLI